MPWLPLRWVGVFRNRTIPLDSLFTLALEKAIIHHPILLYSSDLTLTWLMCFHAYFLLDFEEEGALTQLPV